MNVLTASGRNGTHGWQGSRGHREERFTDLNEDSPRKIEFDHGGQMRSCFAAASHRCGALDGMDPDYYFQRGSG